MFTKSDICWFVGTVLVIAGTLAIDIYRRERKEKKAKEQDDYEECKEVNEKG